MEDDEEGGIPGDASTLIYLAKADAFTEASRCVSSILVPPSVWREAVQDGERIGAPEVPRIRAAAQQGFLLQVYLSARQQGLAEEIRSEHRLGRGESEVLALASRSGTALVDEGRASRVAAGMGILPVSTLFLPVLGARRGSLEPQQAIALLRRLAVVTRARADAVYAIEERLRRKTR
jgi:predicted nucleic acid-binding protein